MDQTHYFLLETAIKWQLTVFLPLNCDIRQPDGSFSFLVRKLSVTKTL